MANEYGDSSIDMLVGAARVRLRPANTLGSDGLDGARHGFTEIYGNALDERGAGYGDKLDIVYYEDGSMSVRDYGRGVPLGWNEKWKKYNWHVVYNEMYGGGKYGDSQDELRKITDWSTFDSKAFNYLFSVGLNGLGAASTQYTSAFFDVVSIRHNPETGKNEKTEMHFVHGLPVINGKPVNVFTTDYDFTTYKQEVVETDEPTGTFIHWLPDDEVFSDINIGGDWLYNVCKNITGVASIDLHFENRQTGFVKDIPAGTLGTLLEDRCGSKLLDENILHISDLRHGDTKVNKKPFIWVCQADVALAFTKHHVDNICFHNSVQMGGGVQYAAVLDAIYRFMNEQGKARGVKFDVHDYDDCFSVVVSTYSNYASFRGQTKDAVDNDFIYETVYDMIYKRLNLELGKKNKVITEIINTAVREAEARIAAKEAAKLVRESAKVTRLKEPDKFVSCLAYENKKWEDAELWITEGDSAAGGVKNARDKATQAIYPIRGKGLNVLKVGLDRILANKEIKEIFALLGTGFDLNVPDMQLFDITKLKFGKIIFATDADEDGYQIRVLLYLIFYKLAPELLRQGKVFIAESPRFKIDLSNGQVLYARNDAERDKILSQNAGRIANVQRFKGLGEVSPAVLRQTTVAPATRNLIPLTIDLQNDMERDFIDALFGADKYHQRKEILTAAFGSEIADMFEENALLLESIDNEDIEEDTEVLTV